MTKFFRFFSSIFSLLSIILFFSLFFSSCASSDQNRESRVNSENSPANKRENKVDSSNVNTNADAGLCSNPYYQVDPQVAREYRVTNPGSKTPDTYVLRQTLDGESSFVEERAFSSGIEMTNKWQCTDEGLRNAEYTNQITMPNARFNMETVESSGITLPKENWKVGEEWQTEYKVKAKLDAGPVSRTVNGTILIENKIVALNEKINVPAGEFETAKVESVIQMNLGMEGQKLPASKVKTIAWYAPSIGVVKQVADTGFGGGTVEYIGKK